MKLQELGKTQVKLDEPMKSCFQALDYFKEARETPMDKLVLRFTLSLDIKDYKDCYRGLILQTVPKDFSNTKEKLHVLSDYLMVCAYFSRLDPETEAPTPGETYTLKDLKSSYNKLISGEDRSRSPQKVGELQPFSGKDKDWLLWKERAIAQFKIDGLYDVVRGERVAALNPGKNTIVHGMLVKALIHNGKLHAFPCLLDNEDDGNLAWRRLTDVYEHEQLIRNTLEDLQHQYQNLTLKNINDWDSFSAEFMTLKNDITMFVQKAKEANIKDYSQFQIKYWKEDFIDKISCQELMGKIEFCRADHEMDLWYTYLTLKGHVNRKRKGGNQKKITFQAGDAEENLDTHKRKHRPENQNRRDQPRRNEGQNVQLQRFRSALEKMKDQTKAKEMLELLNNSKEPADHDGPRKRRRKNRRSSAVSDAPVVDQEAQALIGGSDGSDSD